MSRLFGLGACVLDTLIVCKEYPREDTKLRAEKVFRSGGGPVGNALTVAAKLGLSSAVIGAFPENEDGAYLLSDFEKNGVDTHCAVTVKGAAAFTSFIVLSESAGTRTCVFDRGTVPDDPKRLDFSSFRAGDILHLDGNFLQSAIAAAQAAKRAGALVSIDAGGLYDGIGTLLPYADILIPSKEFALGFTGEKDAASALLRLKKMFSPRVLALTDGANGGLYLDGDKALRFDPVPVHAVDTNGAGDTFHGAFLAAYAEGRTVAQCCDYAAAVAAYKCMHSGVRTFPLDSESIRRFRASRRG